MGGYRYPYSNHHCHIILNLHDQVINTMQKQKNLHRMEQLTHTNEWEQQTQIKGLEDTIAWG